MAREEQLSAIEPGIKKDLPLSESHESKMSVVVARGIGELKEHIGAWRELGDNALEANIFYEAWMMLPAVEAFGAKADFYFVFIYS